MNQNDYRTLYNAAKRTNLALAASGSNTMVGWTALDDRTYEVHSGCIDKAGQRRAGRRVGGGSVADCVQAMADEAQCNAGRLHLTTDRITPRMAVAIVGDVVDLTQTRGYFSSDISTAIAHWSPFITGTRPPGGGGRRSTPFIAAICTAITRASRLTPA